MITTNIDYPESLPYPQRDGYSVKTVQTFQRTSLTSGRARQRRRYSSTPSEYNVSWVFESADDAALFESWFQYTINSGASWFNAKMKTAAGGDGRYVCRFMEMYDGPDPIGMCAWRVSAKLEMWERPINPI